MAKESDVGEVTNLLEKTKVAQLNLLSFKGRSLKLNTAEDADEICEAIKSSKDMQALCLEGNTVGVDAAKAIAEALSKRPEFERALWSDMFTGRVRSEIPPAMEALSDAVISSNAQLVELDLSDNAFGPDGVKACVKLLTSKACYSLKILRFNNNGLGVGGGELLSKALLDCHQSSSNIGKPLKLEVFISGRNRLENPGAKALSEAFKVIKTLVEVQMPQNGIQHEGIAALAEAMAFNPNLKVLNLNDNIFTEKGAEAMAKVLPQLPSIEIINFGDCLVKTDGAHMLADVLVKEAPNLKELHLGYDEINKDGALAIAKALAKKEFLEKIDLNGNCLGQDGVEELQTLLTTQDQQDYLGSMSDDEGDEDDDEDEDIDDLCGDNDSEGDADEVSDVSLQVKGVSIQSKSPLLGTDDDIKQELQHKEVSADDVRNFIKSPTLQMFECFPVKKRKQMIKDALKDDLSEPDKIASHFVKVCSGVNNDKEAISTCADAILGSALKANIQEAGLANSILVYLGFLKSEDKVQPIKDLSGPLAALCHAAQQEYFTKTLASYFIAFMSRPSKILEQYSIQRHCLLQLLYQL